MSFLLDNIIKTNQCIDRRYPAKMAVVHNSIFWFQYFCRDQFYNYRISYDDLIQKQKTKIKKK